MVLHLDRDVACQGVLTSLITRSKDSASRLPSRVSSRFYDPVSA